MSGKGLVLSLLAAVSVSAAPSSVNLRQSKLTSGFSNVLDPVAKTVKGASLPGLKKAALEGRFVECIELAKALGRDRELAGWIWRQRFECALKAAQAGSKFESLRQSFAEFHGSRRLLREGPWAEALVEQWVLAGLVLLEKEKNDAGRVRARADELLDEGSLLSKEQKSQVYLAWGDAALRTGEKEQARWAFSVARDLSPGRAASERLLSLEEKKDVPAMKPEPSQGLEDEVDSEAQDLLRAGRKVEAVEKMIAVLNQFPGGRKAKKFRERIMEAYWSEFERGDNELMPGLREALMKADPQRMAEWAGPLHRRADDEGALALAEKALGSLESSPSSTLLLYIAGRSALFLGQYDKANRHFDRLVQYHAGADEWQEALFRLALLQLRTGNAATSAQLFEKLLQGNTKYELSARYWRVRALQKIASPAAEAESKSLIARFPFSYYGLRLRAEGAAGVLEWPSSQASPKENEPAVHWMLGESRAAWKRFLRLSREGWILEAQQELTRIPGPVDPWTQWNWGKTLSEAWQFPSGILFVNRAMEGEDSLRHPRYLATSFPKAYDAVIAGEAAKYGIAPDVIRSLIRQESAFGLRAVSTSNAMGLMQMIPPTAQDVSRRMKLKVQIPDDMFRPEINVPMGTFYLQEMIDEFGGRLPLALAAYNAGPHRLKRWLRTKPDGAETGGPSLEPLQDLWMDELPWSETSFYVKAILRNILLYRLVDQGRAEFKPDFWVEMVKMRAMTK